MHVNLMVREARKNINSKIDDIYQIRTDPWVIVT